MWGSLHRFGNLLSGRDCRTGARGLAEHLLSVPGRVLHHHFEPLSAAPRDAMGEEDLFRFWTMRRIGRINCIP